jgi:hypothetical protein
MKGDSMPYITQWAFPEVVASYGDVNVYHVYVDDYIDKGKEPYRFTVSPECGVTPDCEGECHHVFDIRDVFPANPHSDIRQMLVVLIQTGRLTREGLKPS